MQTVKFADQEQNNTRRDNQRLDDRYGKIGISAVAGAVRCREDARKTRRVVVVQQETD